MQELLRSSDLVFVSFVEALLAAEGIEAIVFDRHMGAAHTNIDAFPQRVMVDYADAAHARSLMRAAGYASELSAPQ